MTNFGKKALENVLHFTTIQEHGTFILYETFIFLLFEVFHFNFSQLPYPRYLSSASSFWATVNFFFFLV